MGRRAGQRQFLPDQRKERGLPEIPEAVIVQPKGSCECPERFDEDLRFVWARYIDVCYWLTRADETKAIMWCHLRREFLKDPEKMPSHRIRELRMLGGELGMDPDARTRISAGGKKPKDAFSKFS